MKSQTISALIVLAILILFSASATAQCPATKYGLNPVWPVNWTQTDRQNWYLDMAVHGQGFQSDGRTWRQLQVMMDSSTLVPFRDEIIWAKTNGGIEKYLFQLKNPISVNNQMPPVWCGNPLTDTNTTNALYSFTTAFLDTMHQVLDYFVLGSETDIYFKSGPAERDSFFVMAQRISDYIDLHYPEIRFGIGVSMFCALNPDNHYWNMVLTRGDIMSVSWWPLDSYYMADTSEINSADSVISVLLAKCGSKPVVISDCGVTTAMAPERDDIQSEFVRNTFLYTMNVPQIEAVGYYYLADFDTTAIYYQQNLYMTYAPEFHQSIKSRGLMDSLGNPKPSFDVYISMLDTVCAFVGNEEQQLNSEISIWPNPASEKLFVNGNGFSFYRIYATSGQLMAQGLLNKNGSPEIDIARLADGAYILYLISEKKSPENILFIKERQP